MFLPKLSWSYHYHQLLQTVAVTLCASTGNAVILRKMFSGNYPGEIAVIHTPCEQEFLDCAWDQSVNSCVASHHQEAPASEWVHIQKKDDSCTYNLAHHPILSVLLGRTQSPNMPQQYHAMHLRPTPPLLTTTPCRGQKKTFAETHRACTQ